MGKRKIPGSCDCFEVAVHGNLVAAGTIQTKEKVHRLVTFSVIHYTYTPLLGFLRKVDWIHAEPAAMLRTPLKVQTLHLRQTAA